MKLTVLLDNNTLIDRYFLGEPGLSFLIEADGKRILFDAGYSDAFLRNARKMAQDLTDLDTVVLSHGHLEHCWGLIHLVRLYTEKTFEGGKVQKPTLVAHPAALAPKSCGELSEIGSLLGEDHLTRHFQLNLSREPVQLSRNLVYLGEIDRVHDFEARQPLGKTGQGNRKKDDYLWDDSALAYRSSRGLVVITGCSHAGICNIVDQARRITGVDRVVDIIGGFHLQDPSADQLQGTLDYLQQLQPESLHACHCTDLGSKIALAGAAELGEVGVGLKLDYG